MNNIKKGFIVPLLLIIIAVLLVGGGAYVYTQKGQSNNQSPSVGTTPVPEGQKSWCHTFVSNLKKDDGGSEVQFLDIVLQKEKVGTPHSFEGQNPTLISDDGVFIAGTASAVIEFQAKYGIPQTGTVDSATRAKLNSLYGCANAQSTVTNRPSVTVLSPNGGETWKIGQTYTISWQPAIGVGSIQIIADKTALCGEAPCLVVHEGYIAEGVGKYTFTLNNIQPGKYYVRLNTVVGGPTIYSNQFTIAAAGIQ